jgi:hypothetical protein
MKDRALPYISGMIGNLVGFLIGSQFLISRIPGYLHSTSEYWSYVLWCITGLVVVTVGNTVGLLILSRRNILPTVVGATLGLGLGVGFSFVPFLYLAGILSIFFGAMVGHQSKLVKCGEK